MNHVRRLVLKAIKDPKFGAYALMSFDARCLSPYKDWDWGYELSKIDFVRSAIKHPDKKEAKRFFLKNNENRFWYDEYQAMAKRILRSWKKARRGK